ncbi:LytTR family transcriptional regulator DNA-binding domain-containing protein [Erysipelothrix anatis]|uniref:LytTR family transcriptional regulator DNA-binding domain-containing protein n=1 Tax=Erysipelothrix anatis TaxID=2683713 RepID=UPI00135B69DA|nr:LytTR family transcriptional regulator DNA-binding domain-containing protein [Erysipelothrix anatis]
MKIQLGRGIASDNIVESLKHAEIVTENGEYVLYENNQRFLVTNGHTTQYLNSDEIRTVTTQESSLLVETDTESFYTHDPLKTFEVLPLLRINKFTVINLHYITDIRVKLNMKYAVKVTGSWHDVNRTYYHAFKEHIGI